MEKTQTTPGTLFAVPLSTAETCIHNYKDALHTQFNTPKSNIIKGFTIHAEELLEALGIEGVKPKHPKVRVYLGKNQGDRAFDMRLFLTPVNAEGKDIILTGPIMNGLTDVVEPYVFDLNAPCPNTCDTSSPLYNA